MPALFVRLLVVVTCCAAPFSIATAAVKLPNVLSDHMVLQRGMDVPVWGTADAGEMVTVKFREQTKTAKANEQGKWSVKLAPLSAGGPDSLTVSGSNSITINDVLVGDVWVGSGQSNMAGSAAGYKDNDPVLKELTTVERPQLRLLKGNGTWQLCTPNNATQFSAILLSFGIRLQEQIKQPVGLMVGAVGGTPSGYWLTQEMLDADSGCREQALEYDRDNPLEKRQARYEALLKGYEKALAEAKAAGKNLPRKPQLDPAGGKSNGQIGHLYNAHILPMVPHAIRGVLWDQGESGTAIGGVDQFNTMRALILGWRKAWGQDFPFLYVQKPSGFGCAWDYDAPTTAKGDKFSKLPAAVPNDGQYRELHIRIMQHPNTAMVTASDLGAGIHPANKSGYGDRAARVAQGFAYGEKIEYLGPVYESHVVDGNKVRVRFTHVGQGLAHRNGDKLQGFAIAGEDNKFVWADAVIDGDSVVVQAEGIAKPVAVRYGWAANQTWANLFNKDGLPAIPFRTDR